MAASFGAHEDGDYRMKSTRWLGGKGPEPHRDSNGAVVELGEALDDADRRAKSGGRCGGDELGGVVTGRPAMHGSAGRSRATRRSLWAWLKSEGAALGTVAANGGDGTLGVCVRE